MLDIKLRPLKDAVFDPASQLLPRFVSPLSLTLTGLLAGLAACFFAAQAHKSYSLSLWAANRVLDCMDGALARQRGLASDIGGFVDLLCDFIVYSLIPIACAVGAAPQAALGQAATGSEAGVTRFWVAVAAVEVSFHINNFVLFDVAAVVEKRRAGEAAGEKGGRVKELTSVAMRPALVEGFESGVVFTGMLALPQWVELWNWGLAVLVAFGTCQRVVWLVAALGQEAKASGKIK